jgi:hypothetical protein
MNSLRNPGKVRKFEIFFSFKKTFEKFFLNTFFFAAYCVKNIIIGLDFDLQIDFDCRNLKPID